MQRRIDIYQGPQKEEVLTKALLRAVAHFNMERSELSAVLGVSESSLSRLFNQTRLINPQSKEGELVILFLQAYSALVEIFGADFSQCQQWLRCFNSHLNGVPLELMKTISGLNAVVNYLVFMREKI